MTMVCKICSHPKRLEIDRAAISQGNLSRIAREYNVSWSSLNNHVQNHLTHQLATALQKKETIEMFDLADKLTITLKKAERIFRRNYEEHKDNTALRALDTVLNLEPGLDKKQLLKAIEGHIMDQAELMGRYKR